MVPGNTHQNEKQWIINSFDEIAIEEALQMAGDADECFVIGGGMVYKQFLPMAGKLYLTRVHESFEADTFFPEIDFKQWKALRSEEVPAGGKNQYSHSYTEYVRN